MKWIIYLLVLINVVIALWFYRSQEPPVREIAGVADDQALQLILLKEFTDRQYQQSQVVQTEAPAQNRCYTLGPFKTAKIAADVRAQIASDGINAQHRVSKDNTRPGFWVFLPPTGTRKAAQEHVSRLKTQDIKDYFIVVTGEHANAVSLGVFSQADLAQRRLTDLKSLGFDVMLQKVDLPLREYWLDWPKTSVLGAKKLETIRAQNNGAGLTERNCQLEPKA
jgi:hypothetical protein